MIAKLKRMNITLGWISVAIGGIVVLGWWYDLSVLQRFFPQLYPMKSASAWSFIICGLSIASFGNKMLVARIMLGLGLLGVFCIGALNMVYYFLSSPIGATAFNVSLRMSLASGGLFCILSTVLLNNKIRHRYAYKINLFLILFGLAVSILAITGYILDDQALYTLLPFSTMAPHTAVTFIILFIGAFVAIEDNPVLDLISAQSLGGNYARTLLPVGFVLPTFLGILLLAAVRLTLFSLEVSFILLVFLCSLIVTTIVYQKSKLIHRIDLQKQKMLENSTLLNEQLRRLNSELRLHGHELKQNNNNLLAEKEALEMTNESLDTFVHAASHDLKSPVQNMKALHQLMNREKDEVMKKKYLQALESSTNRLEHTINGLIGIVALQSNQQANIERISFREMLDAILADCTLQKGDKLIIDFDNAPSIIYIKPYLQSILRNLITNAIKYRHADRNLTLEITTKRMNKKVLLKVIDNGIGIDLKQYGHLLFQPFKRFSEQAAGSGIGLHLIKSMIEKNGGSIKVQSCPEQGTIFYCELIEY